MTLSNNEFQARLIDYLYGELEGEELRAFEVHLRESDAARRELAAFEKTLRVARDGLAQAVDETPPARVRNAVIAAAEAQLHGVEPQRAARTTRGHEPSGFARWLRAGWFVPALAALAAVALAVFGKQVEPSRMQPDESQAVPTPSQSDQNPQAPPPTAATVPESPRLEAEDPQPNADEQSAPAKTSRSSRARVRSDNGGFAVPPPAWEPKREQAANVESERRSAPAPAAIGSGRATADERQAQPSQDKAANVATETTLGRVRPQRAEPKTSDEIGSMDGMGDVQPTAPAARTSSGASMTAGLTLNDLERRAREHIAAQRWQLAATDYRELLRRYPNDARLPTWKKQLALATRALDAQPNAR